MRETAANHFPMNPTIAWISLAISIIAVVLSFTAFNRTGTDVDQVVEDRVNQARIEMQTQFDDWKTAIEAEIDDLGEDDDTTSTSTQE